jgi:hypothetical protein
MHTQRGQVKFRTPSHKLDLSAFFKLDLNLCESTGGRLLIGNVETIPPGM